MINLLGQTLSQLQQLCAAEGFPRFVARQICDWVYQKRVVEIDAMTNLSLKVRSRLKEIAYIYCPDPVAVQTSKDGTKKYLFDVVDNPYQPTTTLEGRYVECVVIPDGERATLCISCQRGCKMSCYFCVTGRQGFHGNLTTDQILMQAFAIPESTILTNIVYMGMGEPMDNLDAVLQSTQIFTADWGWQWSPRRITVSSVGVTPQVKRFLDESECHLAISLHNPFPPQRMELMPAERAYPIVSLVTMLRRYDWCGQRRLSFEYTLFRGVNDSLTHAAELVSLLGGLRCRVNLIRFHESNEVDLRTSYDATIVNFQNYLNNHGITCTLRASRGQDIMAACGLLAGHKK